TYPDLYVANGNSEIIPNVHRSDVGMTAYFAVDQIPEGWIAFDSIGTTVTQSNYPELYAHLVAKYGSISNVPLAEDRFIRNAGNGLNVGQTQEDSVKAHNHKYKDRYISESGQYDVNNYEIRDERGVGSGSTDHNNIYFSFVEKYTENNVDSDHETRPKSLVLKLCIKAVNNFDDVVFWIKA
ncbi:phage tail protein, partial [Bisgaard Taxon 45]